VKLLLRLGCFSFSVNLSIAIGIQAQSGAELGAYMPYTGLK
jgi:hypothetical protein